MYLFLIKFIPKSSITDETGLACEEVCLILHNSFYLGPHHIWKFENNIFDILYCFPIEKVTVLLKQKKKKIIECLRRRCIDKKHVSRLVCKISLQKIFVYIYIYIHINTYFFSLLNFCLIPNKFFLHT